MRAAVAIALLLLAPLAIAQEHAHANEKGAAVVLYDGPASGRAVVGAYTHFGFALLDKDAAPSVHNNAEFVVTQNGRVLFSTTDTHEYDGLFSFDIRFTEPGAYQVTALSGEMTMGIFEGEVIMPVNATVATVDLIATPQGPASRVVDFELSITDSTGAILKHTDAIVEFRNARDDALFSRAHLHIHEDPILFSQGFGAGTEYVAEVIAYLAFATGRGKDVPAVVASFPVSVGPVSAPAAPAPALAPPAVMEQVGAKFSADGLTLHLMYDPSQQVGLAQTARITGIVTRDENHTFVPHVDFALTLQGPRGLVYSTTSGHEYDGTFEFVFVPDAPGFYDGVMLATYDETTLSVPVHLAVIPPAVPILGGMGLVNVAIDGLEDIVAGQEANLTFSAMGADGPAKHSEVDVAIFREGEAPLYQFKLHTHASGLTNAIVVLPEAGDWQIRVDALPTVPEASIYGPARFAFSVAPGAGLPGAIAGAIDPGDASKVPGAWFVLSVMALAAVGAMRRRRP